MFFDVKFDLGRKARLVEGGNMTGARDEDTYYGVVNIDTVSTYLLLGEIN